ncbi:hypothetical protein [Salinisphaera hydrothermalis]|uniref:hypothetical protein n=1 Tax=Salinisphaera hydrothermalis TaxID=563188 RepID=UPI0012EB81B4|nr:hypothetical protein [Salinisphaera hydrothermalis]
MLAIALAGCASVKTHDAFKPGPGTHMTGVGQSMIQVQKRQALRNAFGKADVFGRTTYAGETDLRYIGMRNGRAVMRVTDVDAHTDKTTMSETGVGFAHTSADVTATPMGAHGESTTTYSLPPTGQTQALPPNVTQFSVDPTSRPTVPVGNARITILSASPQSIRYRIDRAPSGDSAG